MRSNFSHSPHFRLTRHCNIRLEFPGLFFFCVFDRLGYDSSAALAPLKPHPAMRAVEMGQLAKPLKLLKGDNYN
jgi:hypothetical protein